MELKTKAPATAPAAAGSAVAELEAAVERAKEAMFCSSMSDNFYYTSGRRDADRRHLAALEAELAAARGE